jgi:D-glycero-D-manno-heptose 1,7-bisphosphate phosphatase
MSLSSPCGILRPALFLDRDGTLMEEVDHCRDPDDVRAYPGARSLLQRAGQLGFARIIVTNQSGIGRGYFSEADFLAVQKELLRQLGGEIDATYMAPDHPDTASDRRKPAPGMILEAAAEHGIDLLRSWMIGDKPIDIECGRNAGVRTILVGTGYGSKAGPCGEDHRVPSVIEALSLVLAEHQGEPS